MVSNMSPLQLWGGLFFKPKEYFAQYLSHDEDRPFLYTAAFFYASFWGLVTIGATYYALYVDDAAPEKITWLFEVSTLGKNFFDFFFKEVLLSYFLVSWVIAKLLRWLGAGIDISTSVVRRVRLYETALFNAISFPLLIALPIAGYGLKGDVGAFFGFSVLLPLLSFGGALYLYSYTVFYKGLLALTKANRGRLKFSVTLSAVPSAFCIVFLWLFTGFYFFSDLESLKKLRESKNSYQFFMQETEDRLTTDDIKPSKEPQEKDKVKD